MRPARSCCAAWIVNVTFEIGTGAPLRRGLFLFPQPWRAVSMRSLTIALCLLATPALAGASVIDGDFVKPWQWHQGKRLDTGN